MNKNTRPWEKCTHVNDKSRYISKHATNVSGSNSEVQVIMHGFVYISKSYMKDAFYKYLISIDVLYHYIVSSSNCCTRKWGWSKSDDIWFEIRHIIHPLWNVWEGLFDGYFSILSREDSYLYHFLFVRPSWKSAA